MWFDLHRRRTFAQAMSGLWCGKRAQQNMLGGARCLGSGGLYLMYRHFPLATFSFPGWPRYTGRGPRPQFTFGSVDNTVFGRRGHGDSCTLVRVQLQSGRIALHNRSVHSSSGEVWTTMAVPGPSGRSAYTVTLWKCIHDSPGASTVTLWKCRHEGRSVGEVVTRRVHRPEYTSRGGGRSCTPAAYTVCLGKCVHTGPSGAHRRALS